MNRTLKTVAVRAAHFARPGMFLPLSTTAFLYRGTDKRTHGYLAPYRRHLGPLRYRKNRLLEIGVGG